MADLMVLLLMILSAMVPFAVSAHWMMRGRVGYPLTLGSVLGACLAIAVYAASHTIGLDPITAMSAALLVFLPATLGCLAGALLAWLIYRRRHGGGG